MTSNEQIRNFVQGTLGCRCPEEVFRSIECRRDVRLNSFITLRVVLTIGERLLIYIAEAGSEGCIAEHLPVLLASGQRERDEKGLNRFRLVLTADRPEEVKRAAEALFRDARGNDEKLHLHLIGTKDSPFPVQGPEGITTD